MLCRKIKYPIISLLLILSLLLAGCVKEPSADKVREGDPMPSFSVGSEKSNFCSPDDMKEGCTAIAFIDPTCKDCREYVSVLNSCEKIIVISRNENSEEISAFIKDSGLKQELFYKNGRDAYYSLFNLTVPRVIFVKNATIFKIYTEPSLPTAAEINGFVNQK
ncbi:MAG: hypothetical protein HUJ90_01515 [Bacteroidales bacterium]|nr:hypothetical protein [Bacteroidales bacterium]